MCSLNENRTCYLLPGTKCGQKIFQNFFMPKNIVFGPGKILEKTFLFDQWTYFSELVPVLKVKSIFRYFYYGSLYN